MSTVQKVEWLGGPADGRFILISELLLHQAVKVITGTKRNPQERWVKPRQDQYGKWVLPFYEGQIVEEPHAS